MALSITAFEYTVGMVCLKVTYAETSLIYGICRLG